MEKQREKIAGQREKSNYRALKAKNELSQLKTKKTYKNTKTTHQALH